MMRFFSRGHRATAPASDIHRYGTDADGSRNTIHDTARIDIEVDAEGHPIALWFRCLNLPYRTWHRDSELAQNINPHDMEILSIEYREV